MTLRSISKIGLVLAIALAAPAAKAVEISNTNVQLLQGYGFKNILDANFADPKGFKDGTKTTVTINHFDTWAFGDSFFFTDLTRGDLAGSGAQYTDAYVEWHPRLFLNQWVGNIPGLRHWGVATEINQGAGFYAYLGGLGTSFDVPHFNFLDLNVFYRYDNFNEAGWQISPSWELPFSIGPAAFVFAGFIDVNGLHNKATKKHGTEVWSQPELLVDVGNFFGKKGQILAGVEWWYHSQDIGSFSETSSVPQIMVQWNIFNHFKP